MSYFPFTFRFSVPGLSNPFASSAPAASETAATETSDGTHRLKRNGDGSSSYLARPINRRPPPPPGSPPALVRKRGWQPASVEPSQSPVITPSTAGIFDTLPSKSRSKMSDARNNKEMGPDDVELGECKQPRSSRLDSRYLPI